VLKFEDIKDVIEEEQTIQWSKEKDSKLKVKRHEPLNKQGFKNVCCRFHLTVLPLDMVIWYKFDFPRQIQ
jgi:hypothetical protein